MRRPRRPRLFALVVSCVSLASCNAKRERPLFELLSPRETGVTFANTITTTDSENIQSDYFVYNGGGVAAGDVDNDGLPDLYFTGNMVSSRLYLNRGGMKFSDVTERAHVGTTRWATGATMVDINNDGWLDIYVSAAGPEKTLAQDRANLLFVNNGNGTFTEAASQYGIADTGFTTHSVFLDYDRDGLLDLFVLNNSPGDFARGSAEMHPAGIKSSSTTSYSQLYHNNGNGTFTNVSTQAGLVREVGYGLGVVVADFNRDGWPDIYVSNDDTPNDVLYINNRDGTFTNRAGSWLKHTSFAGMGVDAADFNNDGWPDILQCDMLPDSLSQRKRMSGAMTYATLLDYRRRGFRDDFQVNSLQLSNGVNARGDVIFSEVAHLGGVATTEWSWSSTFGDFDNDGWKDILITNGYPKAANDYDYQRAMFGEKRRRQPVEVAQQHGKEILGKLRGYRVPNFVFRNDGDLTFTDKTKDWGMQQPSFSYGAAQVDLDNNGTLDVVINNIDAPAFIYENRQPHDDAHHWLEVRLQGDSLNRRGIGAELMVVAGSKRQYVYNNPYRGYMTTMDDRAHFGLGRAQRVDTLEVVWPDGRSQTLTNLKVDSQLVVKQVEATANGSSDGVGVHGRASDPAAGGNRFFEPLDAQHGLAYRNEVGPLIDFVVQPLLPYMISKHGPAIAVADVNGDGLDDVFIGGGPSASGTAAAGQLFIQQRDGSFRASAQGQPWAADRSYDDWGAQFFDANGDGRPDLYVASGSYQSGPSSSVLQDRLYINKGGGRFARDSAALPTMFTSTAAVRAGDFTGDGKPDLFVGGRLAPRRYPFPTRSYLLRNDGGRFSDVTEQLLPELMNPGGMITDAAWVDFDGDGRLDLVTVGEWMPIHFYHNEGTRFRDVTASMHLPPLRGWWFSLAVGDFDHDGRPDLVAGNLGLNDSYTASRQTRFGVYASEFTGGQTTDVILTQEIAGKEYPLYGMAMLGPQLYNIPLQFPTYAAFSTATISQMFTPSQLQRALHYQVDTLASVFLHNNGNGTFTATALPSLAQIAPIRGVVAHDVDGDGNLDLVVAGNLYDTEPNTPRADAGNGLWLRGDGHGHFTPVPPVESGFLAPGNVSGLALVKTAQGRAILVANTADSLQIFRIKRGR